MAKLSRDKIFATCDKTLFGTGRLPTYDDIRQALGGGGSNTTVARYRAEWEATLAERIQRSAQRPEIPEAVWDASMALWDAANAEARAIAQQKVLDASSRAETEVERARVLVQTAEAKADAAELVVSDLGTRLDASALELANAHRTIASLREEQASLHTRISEASAYKTASDAEIGRLRSELAEARQAAATERAALVASHDGAIARWQQELDSTRTAMTSAAKASTATETALRVDLEKARDVHLKLSRDLQKEHDGAARSANSLADAQDALLEEKKRSKEQAAVIERLQAQMSRLVNRLPPPAATVAATSKKR